jgi:glycosyltransferase involved in cell wall biosynthesis
MLYPVSIVTVSYDTYFFVRLLIQKVQEFVGPRDYEIIVVDRGSGDGTLQWLRSQPDVRLLIKRQWRMNRHTHGVAAEAGVESARYDRIVLLDSDAHPMEKVWLEMTVDRLDDHYRLAGAEFHKRRHDNSYSRYIHPHFMAFFKQDMGKYIVLRKTLGHATDTGEEATQRVLAAGLGVVWHPMALCATHAVGHPQIPTVSAGVFHAWYGTRLTKRKASVLRESGSSITLESYLAPLQAKLRATYRLDY